MFAIEVVQGFVMRSMVSLVVLSLVAAAQQAALDPHDSEKEAALGVALAKEVRRHTQPMEDASVQNYVAGLGDCCAPT